MKRMKRWILCLLAVAAGYPGVSADVPGNFRKENLVAWCIVPFDAAKRGPEERAEMVHALGLKKVAYDWRKPHIPTFEEEILAYRRHGIEMFAFWAGHEEAFALFEKYDLHPQVWKTLAGEKGESQEEKVRSAADSMEPLAKRTGELGCAFGLYNHGGWGGEPANLIAVCEELRSRGHGHVGIVYNFHHAHGHLENWEASFAKMKPYLLCLNLNGMVPGGDKEGKKILTIGEGTGEKGMIEAVIRSGYDGPVGILDHRNETDSAETLYQNITGLKAILSGEG